jgi:hypothetical protein
MEKISGFEALARMREIRHDDKKHFILYHLTYNIDKDKTDGLRIVKRACLRPALPDDALKTESDLYLTYTDLDSNEPRMCFKKLIRFVAFPPDFTLLKVDWFNSKK